jgi:hypothetical protein
MNFLGVDSKRPDAKFRRRFCIRSPFSRNNEPANPKLGIQLKAFEDVASRQASDGPAEDMEHLYRTIRNRERGFGLVASCGLRGLAAGLSRALLRKTLWSLWSYRPFDPDI